MLNIIFAKTCIKKGGNVRKLEDVSKRSQQDLNNRSKKADLAILELALSEHIGCVARLEFSGKQGDKGRLIVEYHNLDILEGIFAKLKFRYCKI